MRFGALLSFALLCAIPVLAGEWPVPGDLSIGEAFRYPILGVPSHRIRPTQAAVGLRAVRKKAKEFSKMNHAELKEELKSNPIPVVIGPDGNLYMIDHHHQALAALEVGRENAFFVVEKDFSKLNSMDEFWTRMKRAHWVREFDDEGRPIRIPEGLPKSLRGLRDDPYRSLAWYVRKEGGYRKTAKEFAEFEWADFFRSRVPIGRSKTQFEAAVEKALGIAHSPAAKGLPGWSRRKICEGIFDPEGES